MILNTSQKLLSLFLVVLIAFWLVLFVTNSTTGFYNYFYSFLFGLIPLIGGVAAMMNSKKWGGLKTAIGKAVFFIGLGLVLWGSGETIWSYYNFFLGVAAPYPSLADVGFAPSIFFYGLGAIYLSRASGAKFGLRSGMAKVGTAVVIIAMAVIAYYVLVVLARGGVLIPEGETALKSFLDIAYPVGDFLALAIAAVISSLSLKYMGGRYTVSMVSILFGLFVMFIADSIFSYTTTIGTYYNANGGDLILTLGLFFLTFGVLGFSKER